MKTCIIDVAIGANFPLAQDRLNKSLDNIGYTGGRLFWKNSIPDGCPPHSQIHYAFKPYAIREAQRQGYDLAIWADSCLWAIRPLDVVFDYIEKQGYMFFLNTAYSTKSGTSYSPYLIGEWCSDAALQTLKITREEAFDYPQLMACCMGFDLRNQVVKDFIDQWFALANDGVTFTGSCTNNNREVSSDERVRGHRHDQTAASVLTRKLGMTNWLISYETYLLYYSEGDIVGDSIVFLSRGM
jgi:hypothetical protein